MSKELDPDYKCLVLYAALFGKSFTKSQLGLTKMSIATLDSLTEQTGLLKLTRKGRSRELEANAESVRWAGEHLYAELKGSAKAVCLVLDLVRAKRRSWQRIIFRSRVFLKPR
jgi:hypothetical protein